MKYGFLQGTKSHSLYRFNDILLNGPFQTNKLKRCRVMGIPFLNFYYLRLPDLL